MIKGMTGFGTRASTVPGAGKVCVEIRSFNHRFLETVLHLPEGYLFLEDKIKKEIESRVKRGRITCVVNIAASQSDEVFINKGLLKKYLSAIKDIKQEFCLKDGLSLDSLLQLPGVLSLAREAVSKTNIWPRLEILIKQATDNLVKMRQKEGQALYVYLKSRSKTIKAIISAIQARFKQAVHRRLLGLKTDEERASFLKDADIGEELNRLEFHIRSLFRKLAQAGPQGKELDFIAQEMQREANTMAAKSFDTTILAKAVQLKSQIEKIREQLQNVE